MPTFDLGPCECCGGGVIPGCCPGVSIPTTLYWTLFEVLTSYTVTYPINYVANLAALLAPASATLDTADGWISDSQPCSFTCGGAFVTAFRVLMFSNCTFALLQYRPGTNSWVRIILPNGASDIDTLVCSPFYRRRRRNAPLGKSNFDCFYCWPVVGTSAREDVIVNA